MNGERRMRLTERYMDPPGSALPDSLIVARIAQALERSWRAAGKEDVADKFKGYDWKTEEDAFMDGYHQHEKGGEFVTYARLRAMGTNGFQEPAIGLEGAGPAGGGTTTAVPAGMRRRQGSGQRKREARSSVQQAGTATPPPLPRRHRTRAHHRHQAALRGRKVQQAGRQGGFRGRRVARLPGCRASRRRRTSSPS